MTIDVVHIGLGPLGQKMVRSAVQRGSIRLVGAVDTDPAKIGKDLGEFCGMGSLGVTIAGGLDDAIRGKSPQVAVVTTVSSLAAFEPQLPPWRGRSSTWSRHARNSPTPGGGSRSSRSGSTRSAATTASPASARASIRVS